MINTLAIQSFNYAIDCDKYSCMVNTRRCVCHEYFCGETLARFFHVTFLAICSWKKQWERQECVNEISADKDEDREATLKIGFVRSNCIKRRIVDLNRSISPPKTNFTENEISRKYTRHVPLQNWNLQLVQILQQSTSVVRTSYFSFGTSVVKSYYCKKFLFAYRLDE